MLISVHHFTGIFVLLSLLLFLPLFLNISKNISNSDPSFDKDGAHTYALCSLAAITPLLMDGITDFLFYWDDSPYLIMRMTLKFSFFVYTLVASASHFNAAALTVVSTFGVWQIFIESGIALWFLHEFDDFKVITPVKIVTLLTIFFSALFLEQINDFYGLDSITTAGTCLKYIFIAGLSLVAIQWALVFSNRGAIRKRMAVKYEDKVCIAFFSMGAVVIPVWVSLQVLSRWPAYLSDMYIKGDFILRFFVIYVIASCTKRVIKHKVQEYRRESAFKSELVKYLSHEVRNPLNILAMSLEHMKLEVNKGNLDPTFMKESIVSLERGSCGLLEVLNELVIYEEIESGGMKLHLADLNPFSLLRRVLISIGEIGFPFGVLFRIVASPADRELLPFVMVNVDLERIQLVLTKVLSKCIYDHQSGDKVPIKLSLINDENAKLNRTSQTLRRRSSTVYQNSVEPTETCHGVVRISVPLPGDISRYSSHINEYEEARFAREAHGDNQRIGLSIWISRRIISLHGGDMGFTHSPVNAGGITTSIYIDLPFRKDPNLQSNMNSNFISSLLMDDERGLIMINSTDDPSASPPARVRRIFKILVVDDSSLNRKVLVKVMECLGHSCDQADDGDVAVSMVKSGEVNYDIILME
jgi:signal transduction histidine kinase